VFSEGQRTSRSRRNARKRWTWLSSILPGIEVGSWRRCSSGAATVSGFSENKGRTSPARSKWLRAGIRQPGHARNGNTFSGGRMAGYKRLQRHLSPNAGREGRRSSWPGSPHQRRHLAIHRKQKKKKLRGVRRGNVETVGHGRPQHRRPVILAVCVHPAPVLTLCPGGIYKRQAGASFNTNAYRYMNEICDHNGSTRKRLGTSGCDLARAPHCKRFKKQVIFGQHPRLQHFNETS